MAGAYTKETCAGLTYCFCVLAFALICVLASIAAVGELQCGLKNPAESVGWRRGAGRPRVWQNGAGQGGRGGPSGTGGAGPGLLNGPVAQDNYKTTIRQL